MHKTTNSRLRIWALMAALALVALVACGSDGNGAEPTDPDTAPEVEVDRFGVEAGTLFVRDDNPALPDANEPIDFDQGPFITRGLGPDGEMVEYYNFDVMHASSAPIFALFREGESMPVEGQLNIIDVIPGDEDYSDFWHVHKVTVPSDYEANTLTSVDAIMDSGYVIERTEMVVNCPVVPEGSTATKRMGDGDSGLVRGWYKGQVVYYFDFSEKMLTVNLPPEGHPDVPASPIYVSFNINPDPEDPASGPASGFMTETGTMQTHNVVATLPADDDYSPLWQVNIYDNADFDAVMDLTSAMNATLLGAGPTVNCPIVSVQ
jgi:hypothetical protein